MAEFPVTKPQFIVPSCVNLSTYIQGMSDYEVRCYYTQLVQQWATEWAQMQTEWSNQQEAFESFKQYVNDKLQTFQDWFDNLDVQQEINNKIDEMVSDGSFLAIIQSTVNSQTQAATDSWLETNMTPGVGAPALDSSFTLKNAAAQAKAVGDKCPQANALTIPDSEFDFNDYTSLGFYWLYWLPGVNGKNAPFEPIATGSNILLYVHSRDSKNVAQFVVNLTQNNTSPVIAVRRMANGSWGPWRHDLSNSDLESAVNSAEQKMDLNAGVSMFDTVAVIGDSLSVGYNQTKNGTVIRPVFKQSWPQYLVNLYGTTVYWCGFSGATTKSFLDDDDTTASVSGLTPRGMTYTETIGPKALYIIQLGVNDAAYVELGTPSDVGTNAETFYGMLSKIVENVHTLAPDSFVLVATPIFDISSGYEDAIEYVGGHYDYSGFVDFRPYLSELRKLAVAGHYTQLGYYKAGAAMNVACGQALSDSKFLYINDANNSATISPDIDPYD